MIFSWNSAHTCGIRRDEPLPARGRHKQFRTGVMASELVTSIVTNVEAQITLDSNSLSPIDPENHYGEFLNRDYRNSRHHRRPLTQRSGQRIDQGARVLNIDAVGCIVTPRIDRLNQLQCFLTPSLVLPQLRQAQGGPEFTHFGPLTARYAKGGIERTLRRPNVAISIKSQKQISSNTMQL